MNASRSDSEAVPDRSVASPFRVGIGYDSHRLGAGGPLRIGGVDIAGDHHAIGHSDADVLLHAITDAILGGIAAPDIGRLFPDTSAANAGRDSFDFLGEAVRRLDAAGFGLVNIDSVILAQRPKMAPHIDRIRQRITDFLQVPESVLNIKAKTGEGVGEIGRGELIAARVVVLLAAR